MSPYQKCDYKNNKCVDCQRGKDPACIQTADYCKVAQQRGLCKPQTIAGLYRMIMVQKGYKVGEFDMLFDAHGNLASQMYVTSATSLGKGKVAVTGTSDAGETLIHITEWTGSPIQAKSGYGVYKLKPGQSQTLNLLELSMSKTEIKELDDGLKEGNAYFVGVSCKDTKNCDFSKATPATMTMQDEYYEFLDA